MRRPNGVQVVTPSLLLVLVLGFLQSASAPPLPLPGPGLEVAILAASVSDTGIASVRFTLTDTAGVPLTPTASSVSSASDPALARVRFAIARLEVNEQTDGASTVQFTRYMNYLLNASGEPTFDTGGSFLLEDQATGTYRYTFGGSLPAPFPASAALVHTIGAQVDRFFEGGRLAANPIFDFVPDARPTTGAGPGGGPHVRGLNSVLGLPLPGALGSFFAYNPAFAGGVRVAVCDLTGDGIVDTVTGPGPGGGPHVRAFDGVTGAALPGPVGSFMVFDPAFVGGVFVACGDLTGDGTPDVIAAADAGGGPHVRAFDGKTGAEVASFFAFDAAFTGGVRVAACDVNNDGRADIVTAAGPGGEPRVKVFNGQNPAQQLSNFLAYDPAFAGGVFVGCGALRGSTEARIITGAGAGGGPHIRGFDGATGLQVPGPVGSFFAYDPGFTGGVQVATCDLTGDGILDAVTGAGPSGGPHVRAFDGATGLQVPGPIGSFFAYGPGFAGGVLVACNPGKSALTLQREPVSTAACNECHNPLAVHGGGRREVRLCMLCHTEQLVDTDTGNRLDFKVLIHKVHSGKELPSVADGPVGTQFAIGNDVFAAKVQVCVLGPKEGAPCTANADCGTGTCTGTAATGVGFPQDIRNCTKCHTGGATSHTFKTLPSTPACTGCHDDVNPSTADIVTPPQSNLGTLLAGQNHDGGPQSEAACAGCHTPGDGTPADEAGISVTGAHTVPQRSLQLPGLVAELLEASGTPGSGIEVRFRLKNGDGTPILSLDAPVGTISVRASGPTTDFGGSTKPMLSQNVTGATGPDVDNAFTFTTTGAATLPGDAVGTWRVGLEARRALTINLVGGPTMVTEFAQNPVLDFSVDASPVVPRRTVVAIGNCQQCHGVFSQGFSVHGGSRNQTELCVICHNPNVSDFARRVNAYTYGQSQAGTPSPDLANEPINLKHLLHKVHTGEDLENKPYIVYGFGGGPKNYTAHDFSEIRFPGDRRDCATCHVGDSQLLPLPSNLLPTRLSVVTPGTPPTETVTGSILPITDACLACHDSVIAATHAAINTLGGIETCEVCHGEGSLAAVSLVHRR